MTKEKTSVWVLWAKDEADIYILSVQDEMDKSIELKFGDKYYIFTHPIYAPDILKRDFPDYEFGYEEKPFEFEL